jgi:hypothetical protein
MKSLRTNNGFYVCELRGAVFVTWVHGTESEHALKIPDSKAEALQEYVFQATGIDTEIIEI